MEVHVGAHEKINKRVGHIARRHSFRGAVGFQNFQRYKRFRSSNVDQKEHWVLLY
jgi:hypothetical protein